MSLQALADDDECVVDMSKNIPSSWKDARAVEGNWGGFLMNNSCALAFERYLYALAEKANKTGEIFMSMREQKDCLNAINMSERDVLRCGIDRLTSGRGGCSDYSVKDVVNEQRSGSLDLDEGCKNSECNSCLGRWEEVGRSANASNREEGDVCRFSLLVAETSRRMSEMGWIDSIYTCLGNGIPQGDEAREGKKISVEVVGGSVAVGVISIVAAIVIVWVKFLKKRMSKRTSGSNDYKWNCVKIPLTEVHRATDNLSAANLIGEGISGKVYKGVLWNGQRVAVKHIMNDKDNEGQMETFVREVRSLSHVKHPNLVELIGHCDGEDESFLVYQLCENGNLSEWLFAKHRFLTWIQRLEIAIDCARGLSFLHTYPQGQGCIVHRDIKPTNILLGANFEAKLSDFGLSKVINMGFSHVSSEVRGTFGYVDPEYQKNRHVHPCTDVYSFGVVLLQLLSGQRVINLELTRPMPLTKM
ncbi:hypothetical protein C2S51_020430, partial [Perilla frutescens var. frutescens]